MIAFLLRLNTHTVVLHMIVGKVIRIWASFEWQTCSKDRKDISSFDNVEIESE